MRFSYKNEFSCLAFHVKMDRWGRLLLPAPPHARKAPPKFLNVLIIVLFLILLNEQNSGIA